MINSIVRGRELDSLWKLMWLSRQYHLQKPFISLKNILLNISWTFFFISATTAKKKSVTTGHYLPCFSPCCRSDWCNAIITQLVVTGSCVCVLCLILSLIRTEWIWPADGIVCVHSCWGWTGWREDVQGRHSQLTLVSRAPIFGPNK